MSETYVYIIDQYKMVKFSHSLKALAQWGLKVHLSTADYPAPFVALSFPDSKKQPIYCWVDRDSFPVVGWRSLVSI